MRNIDQEANALKLSRKWWVLFLVSLAVMVPFMAPYATLSPSASRIDIRSASVQYPVLIVHILASFVALLAGFLQFIPRLRARRPELHRLIGRLYVLGVFTGAATALSLVFYIGTYTKAVAFLALALTWAFTCWRGFRAAMQGRLEEHRRWMLRSFGLTLVAVAARLLVPLLLLIYALLHGFELPDGRSAMVEAVLDTNIWAGLIVNVIVVEWVLLRPQSK